MVQAQLKSRIELIEELLSITDKHRRVVPFKLNKIQRYLLENKGSRNFILKARQHGCSSVELADMFIEAITIPNTVCVVVSHETFATQRLLDRVHFFYDTFPEPKPTLGAESRSELSFPILHSVIYIGTARSMTFGRGDTISKALLSELAFYEDGERIVNAIEEAVPLWGEITTETTPNGEICPNGERNIAFDMWVRARERKSGYKPFFFPWWLGEDYSIPRGSPYALEEDREDIIPTGEERELMDKFHITEDQIRWRRRKVADKGGLFFQEYPEDEVTCFQTSGEPVFDSLRLQELARGCYDGEKQPMGWIRWKEATEKDRYVVGADCSSGVTSYSAAVVLDDNFHVVATYQGRIEPAQFVPILRDIGKYYSNAELAIERNAQGYAVLAGLVDYPNIHLQRDFTTGKVTSKPGWWTSEATKAYMFSSFKEMLPRFTTWDINLVRQARSYVYIKYRPTAQSYDDLLIAGMIGVAVKKMVGGARGYQGNVPGWGWVVIPFIFPLLKIIEKLIGG